MKKILYLFSSVSIFAVSVCITQSFINNGISLKNNCLPKEAIKRESSVSLSGFESVSLYDDQAGAYTTSPLTLTGYNSMPYGNINYHVAVYKAPFTSNSGLFLINVKGEFTPGIAFGSSNSWKLLDGDLYVRANQWQSGSSSTPEIGGRLYYCAASPVDTSETTTETTMTTTQFSGSLSNTVKTGTTVGISDDDISVNVKYGTSLTGTATATYTYSYTTSTIHPEPRSWSNTNTLIPNDGCSHVWGNYGFSFSDINDGNHTYTQNSYLLIEKAYANTNSTADRFNFYIDSYMDVQYKENVLWWTNTHNSSVGSTSFTTNVFVRAR